MSIAWATVALLILLVPGILFGVGFYLPANITRETVPRTPILETGLAVVTSFIIHALSVWLLRGRIEMSAVLSALQLQGSDSASLADLGRYLEADAPWILAYVTGTSLTGLLSGLLVGVIVANTQFGRGVIEHGWALHLRHTDGPRGAKEYTFAYVMSGVTADDRVLMYRGVLRNWALAKDGSFAYLVLSQPYRYYMFLAGGMAVTESKDRWHRIGTAGSDDDVLPFIVISGNQISNVVFDRFDLQLDRDTEKQIRAAEAELDLPGPAGADAAATEPDKADAPSEDPAGSASTAAGDNDPDTAAGEEKAPPGND